MAISLKDIIIPKFYVLHNLIKASEYVEYWLKGGRGTTKSSVISIEIILGMIKDPEANAICFRKYGVDLGASVYNQLLWAIDMLGVADEFRVYKSPLCIVYIPTNQKILFRGLDDPKKTKSIKTRKGYFKFIWFEELEQYSGMEEIRSVLQSLMRSGQHFNVFCSYNPPKTQNNWVNKEVLIPKHNRYVVSSNYLDVPPEWLGKAFIDEAEILKEQNPKAYAHEYLGEVTGSGGMVFENLEIRAIEQEEIDSIGKYYQGVDFGWFPDPSVWLRLGYLPSQNKVVIFDEIYSQKLTNDKLASMILAKTQALEYAFCDCADPRSINELKRLGVYALPVAKGAGSVDFGIEWLAKRKIIIDPVRCPNTAREFSGYELEKNKDGDFISSYPDRDNHSIDACRYALERIMKTGS